MGIIGNARPEGGRLTGWAGPRGSAVRSARRGQGRWRGPSLAGSARTGCRGFGGCLRDAAVLDEFGEESLEAGGGDDLEDPTCFLAGVPERVPLVAGFEDELARTGFEHLLAEEGSHAAFQHVAVLVLARMPV